MNVVNLKIADIRVPEGRRALHNVAELAQSINEIGLLNPITVTPGNLLLTGAHRLEACRMLEWSDIPCVVRDESPLVWRLMTIDENLIRNDLTTLERAEELDARKRVYEQLYPDAPTKAGRPNDNSERRSSFSEDTSDKTGFTERFVQQHVQIARKIVPDVKAVIRNTTIADSKTDLLALARLKEDEQKRVAEVLKTQPVESVKQAVHIMRKSEHVENFAADNHIDGLYSCIVVDPPWPYEYRAHDTSHRSRNPYSTMSIDEIKALDIPATDDCVIWLWTTNAFMREAYEVADAWGLAVKTILTWAKDKMGLGDWLRGKTEHCLMCVKGNPPVNLTNQTTLLEAPNREHSRKPDEFFEMVNALCYGRMLEMFARTRREGWDAHGDQVGKF